MFKTISLILSLLLSTSFAFAQSNEEILKQIDQIEANHDYDAKILEFVKDGNKDGKHTLKHKNFKRNAGKVGSIISTKINKPFVASAGFLRGLFQKSSKNQDLYAISRLIVKHEQEIEDAIVNGITDDKGNVILERVATMDDLEEALSIIIPGILTKKLLLIMTDVLVEAGVDLDLSKVTKLTDLLDLFEELDEEQQATIIESVEKIDMAKVNNHEEFEDLRLLMGDLTSEQLFSLLVTRDLEIPEELEVEEILKKLGLQTSIDLVSGVVLGNIASSIVLGQITGALGGIYATVAIASTATHALSVTACLKNSDLIENDDDFARFCSYVVYASGNELVVGRSKGFVAGKNTRLKIEKLVSKIKANLKRANEKRKAKRDIRRKARAAKREAKGKNSDNLLKRTSTKIKSIFKK